MSGSWAVRGRRRRAGLVAACLALWCGMLGTARADAGHPQTAAGAAAPPAATAPQAWPSAPESPRLALIKQRGSLVVGVKTDYPPFGFLRADGSSAGLEHEMAEELARRLGVTLTKVSVTGTNRLQWLEEGRIDLVVATTGDTVERRKIATMVEPNYYASGVVLFMRPGPVPTDWSAIRGHTVCATQGSYFNRAMAERHLLQLELYNSPRDARLAVRDKRCIGYLFDNTAIWADLKSPEWQGYQAPLPPVLVTPWAVAIAASERGTQWDRFLGDTLAEWHRTGWLIEREKAWGLPASTFLVDMHNLWRSQRPDGSPLCQREGTGGWPEECRNKIFLNSTETTGLRQIGLWVRERTGADLSVVYDAYDRTIFLRGLAMTVALTLMCLVGSFAVGVFGALVAESRQRWASAVVQALGTWWRMTPPLLAMYLILFGIGAHLASAGQSNLSPTAVVVACLSLYTGSSVMVALLRATEARRQQTPAFRLRVSTLPQVMVLASPAVTAALVNVSKATMMASAVAVPEVMSATTSIIAERGNPGVMMNVLLVAMFLLIFAATRGLRWLDRKVRSGSGA